MGLHSNIIAGEHPGERWPISLQSYLSPLHFCCRTFVELNHNEPVPEVLVNILDSSLEAATVKPQRSNTWLVRFYQCSNLYQPLPLPRVPPMSPSFRLLIFASDDWLPTAAFKLFYCLQIVYWFWTRSNIWRVCSFLEQYGDTPPPDSSLI